MSNTKEFRPKKSTGSAVLKVKYLGEKMNPEVDSFEDIVTSSNTSIKIDFNDGISLMEDNFKRHDVLIEKFFIDFFDNYKNVDFMDYLSNEDSDFRVTTSDGVIIRLSKDDMVLVDGNQDDHKPKGKHDGNSILQYLKKKIVWK